MLKCERVANQIQDTYFYLHRYICHVGIYPRVAAESFREIGQAGPKISGIPCDLSLGGTAKANITVICSQVTTTTSANCLRRPTPPRAPISRYAPRRSNPPCVEHPPKKPPRPKRTTSAAARPNRPPWRPTTRRACLS